MNRSNAQLIFTRIIRFSVQALFTSMLLAAPTGLTAEEVQLDSKVSFVGERYWFRARLPGIWKYGLSENEDGIQLVLESKDEGDPVLGQTITVTEKTAFEDWPEDHTAEWAADAYRQWEFDNMKAEGVKTGMYRLRDTKMSEITLEGTRLFTFTYKQAIMNPFMRDAVNHAFLFLYFPDNYETSHKFYWIHYLQARGKKDKGRPSLDLVRTVIAGFSMDRDNAPSETTISWSTATNKHVYMSAPEQQRTYYFNNDSQRQCYSFHMDGIWFPASVPGILGAGNQYDHGGITLLSEDELNEFEGENLVSRAANCEIKELEKTGEAKVVGTSVEPLACVFENTVKWTADFSLKIFGQNVLGKNAWYISEVKPGWVAVVQATQGTNTGDDDMARDLFDALVLSDSPSCFSQETELLVN